MSNFLLANLFVGSWLLAAAALPLGKAAQSGEPDAKLLISPRALIEWPEDAPRPVILDVRGEAEYRDGHVPGAVRVDIGAWKSATAEDTQLLDSEWWANQLGSLGIDGKRTVVVYGSPITEAARVWWLLKFVGCRDVRLLDGGWDRYRAAGGVVSQEEPKVGERQFVPEFQLDRFISADELLAAAVEKQQCQIVDNRSEREFRGQDDRNPRSGHIPGARHSDWQEYLAEDGTFLPPEKLRERLLEAGVDLDRPLATHCQSGGRSSVGAFVLELVTGRPARNYYRSWGEWSRRSDLPIDK